MSKLISEARRRECLPRYALTEASTPAEVREMAARAMHNELMIPWTPNQTLRYHKEGYCSNKEYVFEENCRYVGLPYSDAGGSLIQFLQYLDPKTGCITLPDPDNANRLIGNMCGESVLWALAAVSPAICGGMQSGFMTTHQGLYPVGKWYLDPRIESYLDYSTYNVTRDNGKEVILNSYTKARRGHALCCSAEAGNKSNHALIIVADPHVEYLPNGEINEVSSYIMIQDQRSGTKQGGLELVLDDGKYYQSMGRAEAPITFRELWAKGFVPLATAEMLGKKKPSPARVQWEFREDGTLAGLLAGEVRSNFILCTLRLTLKNEAGDVVYNEFRNFSTPDVVAGNAWKQPLSFFDPRIPKGEYQAALTALPANGEVKRLRRQVKVF